MRLYIDLSCVNRVIDDQSQERIRLETEREQNFSIPTEFHDLVAFAVAVGDPDIVFFVDVDAVRKYEPAPKLRRYLPEESNLMIGARFEPAQELAPHLSKIQMAPSGSMPIALVWPNFLPSGSLAQPSSR